MCCEICPRYTSCEEEGHISELCCVSCPDRKSCAEDSGAEGEASAEEAADDL